jgi:hypothetical protein
VTERYRVIEDSEHGCCWDRLIIDTYQPLLNIRGETLYGHPIPDHGYVKVCETDEEYAATICAALNLQEGMIRKAWPFPPEPRSEH